MLQIWKPDDDPELQRRMGKSLEELGELIAVCARITIQGVDAIDPASGKSNRQRLSEETADVLAQLQLNINYLRLDEESISARVERKQEQMQEWESHFQGVKDGF